MPELPEVETIVRGLRRRVVGDAIESVWVGSRRQPLKSPAGEIAATLEGTRVRDVHRMGKHIVVDLEPRDGHARRQWIVHLGMTGSLRIVPAETAVEKHTHLVARLKSGRELRFVDPRMFGKLAVVHEPFTTPGAEPLDVGFEAFRSLFRRRKTPIKSALLNQKLLRGVGNIYADEALFRAGVRPRRRAASLTGAELHRLYESLQQVLSEAIEAGGSSISDYVDADGDPGEFQFQHRVYQRDGEPCLVCRTTIKRVVIAGRSSHYCPKCQR